MRLRLVMHYVGVKYVNPCKYKCAVHNEAGANGIGSGLDADWIPAGPSAIQGLHPVDRRRLLLPALSIPSWIKHLRFDSHH